MSLNTAFVRDQWEIDVAQFVSNRGGYSPDFSKTAVDQTLLIKLP